MVANAYFSTVCVASGKNISTVSGPIFSQDFLKRSLKKSSTIWVVTAVSGCPWNLLDVRCTNRLFPCSKVALLLHKWNGHRNPPPLWDLRIWVLCNLGKVHLQCCIHSHVLTGFSEALIEKVVSHLSCYCWFWISVIFLWSEVDQQITSVFESCFTAACMKRTAEPSTIVSFQDVLLECVWRSEKFFAAFI